MVATAALALSAGVVAAALPSLPEAASTGLDRASEAAGMTVPVRAGEDHAAVPDSAPDSSSSDSAGAVDEAAGAEHPDNHGATVSAAAQGPTPQAFDNHGAWVSSVARQNHGQEQAASASSKGATTSAERRPTSAGKPDTAGKPGG
jgi:hypothetical protein